MIEQQGKVLRTEGTHAWVRVGGTSGCAACDSGHGCGAGVFARLLNRRPMDIRVANSINARPGKAVLLGIPESLFLALVWRLYGMPLLAGLVGAVLGHEILRASGAEPWMSDLATLLAAMVVAVLAHRGLSRQLHRHMTGLQLRMVAGVGCEEI